MIIDLLQNLGMYASVNPHFTKVIEFINTHNLSELEAGKHIIDGDNVFVNVMTTAGKTKEDATMETHKNMLDIQIPFNVTETMGYTPTERLPEAEYNEAKDCTKHPGVQAESYIAVKPGMMAIFWPQDGHQPCISDAENIHKAVFKVKVD